MHLDGPTALIPIALAFIGIFWIAAKIYRGAVSIVVSVRGRLDARVSTADLNERLTALENTRIFSYETRLAGLERRADEYERRRRG